MAEFVRKRGLSTAQVQALIDASGGGGATALANLTDYTGTDKTTYPVPSWDTTSSKMLHQAIISGGVIIAAADSPAAWKVMAKSSGGYVCDGTADEVEMHAVRDALFNTGGTVVFAPGNFYTSAPIMWYTNFIDNAANAPGLKLDFAGQSTIRGTWATAATDLVMGLFSWKTDIINANIVGGGRTKGVSLGLGYQFGSAKTITTAARTGSSGAYTLTYTTSTAHGLAVGEPVTIEDTSVSGFDGTFNVTAVGSSTTFSVLSTSSSDPGASATGGTACRGCTVHDCTIKDSRFSSAYAGVEFSVVGGKSTGDNYLTGSNMASCTYGVQSKGFINYIEQSRFNSCDWSVIQTTDRSSGAFVMTDCVHNEWKVGVADIQRGRGSTIAGVQWAERVNAVSPAPTELFRIGTSSYKPVNVEFSGRLHLHPGGSGTTETHIFKINNVEGLSIDHIELTNEFGTNSTAIFKLMDTLTGMNNVVEKISYGDTVSGWLVV